LIKTWEERESLAWDIKRMSNGVRPRKQKLIFLREIAKGRPRVKKKREKTFGGK